MLTITKRARQAVGDGSASASLQVLLLAIPVLLILFVAWQKRFITDDGFINFRIVDQVFAGNGPVYNAGQRSEVYSSPAWLAILVVGRALFGWTASMGQIAVGLGLLCIAGAVLLAELGALRFAQAVRGFRADGQSTADGSFKPPPLLDRRVLHVPAGAIVFVCFPPTWYWATSGLDSSVFLFWLALCFYLTATIVNSAHVRPLGANRSRLGRRWAAAAALVGSGWLVRPDAALFSIGFLAILVACCADRASRIKVILFGLAPSAIYEIFRMGYFASLVPNTALAKEPFGSSWARGVDYLHDTTSAYSLWPVLVACLALGAAQLAPLKTMQSVGAKSRWRVASVVLVPTVIALVHVIWVIRLGGDYLHARFLLPAVFVLTWSCFVVRIELARDRGSRSGQARWLNQGAIVLILVALASWSSAEVIEHGAFRPDELEQEPEYIYFATSRNPTELDDFPLLAQQGYVIAARANAGADVLIDATAITMTEQPGRPGAGTIAYVGATGVTGQAAGTEAWVIDAFGLADPIGARLPPALLERAGHKKVIPMTLVEARHAADPRARTQTMAARHGVECGDVAELVAATEQPLTLQRFLTNLAIAPKVTRLEVPSSGTDMETKFCSTP